MDNLFSTREVSTYLRAREEKVMQWHRAGKLVEIKLGAKSGWRVSEVAFIAFLVVDTPAAERVVMPPMLAR